MDRTKDNFFKARNEARMKAEKLHPGQGGEYMHDFPPWWCLKELWAQMCTKWLEEDWKKKSTTASSNRTSGSLPGAEGRAPGTYRGGTKSMTQYMSEEVSHG